MLTNVICCAELRFNSFPQCLPRLDILDNISFDRVLLTSIKKDGIVFEKLLDKGIERKKIVMME